MGTTSANGKCHASPRIPPPSLTTLPLWLENVSKLQTAIRIVSAIQVYQVYDEYVPDIHNIINVSAPQSDVRECACLSALQH